jgi:CheY-like chemotaxis protein
VLSFQLAPDLPPILGDASQMRQVIMNLVLNAAEALGPEGGVITVATDTVHADAATLAETLLGAGLSEGEYVTLEVRDTGSGMDEATRARIFEPFFTTKFTGRGLGLSAVQGIVRGHQGTLTVTSEPGQGSTFRLLFPHAPDTAYVAQPPAQEPPRGGTILVVDDEDGVRGLALRLLVALGFHVVEAADGPAALDQLRRHAGRIRLVLLDWTMPGLDGEETLRQLRQVAGDVPVILMSGFGEQEVRERFDGLGLSGFLQKPFTRQDLTERVTAALRPG